MPSLKWSEESCVLETDLRSHNTPATCGFNQEDVNHFGDKIENSDSLETSAVELAVCLYRADVRLEASYLFTSICIPSSLLTSIGYFNTLNYLH